jgi:hypothetical protein
MTSVMVCDSILISMEKLFLFTDVILFFSLLSSPDLEPMSLKPVLLFTALLLFVSPAGFASPRFSAAARFL